MKDSKKKIETHSHLNEIAEEIAEQVAFQINQRTMIGKVERDYVMYPAQYVLEMVIKNLEAKV